MDKVQRSSVKRLLDCGIVGFTSLGFVVRIQGFGFWCAGIWDGGCWVLEIEGFRNQALNRNLQRLTSMWAPDRYTRFMQPCIDGNVGGETSGTKLSNPCPRCLGFGGSSTVRKGICQRPSPESKQRFKRRHVSRPQVFPKRETPRKRWLSPASC